MATPNALVALIGKNVPLGTGTAEQARQALISRAYQLHVQEATAMGEKPMTPEQFAAQQRN